MTMRECHSINHVEEERHYVSLSQAQRPNAPCDRQAICDVLHDDVRMVAIVMFNYSGSKNLRDCWVPQITGEICLLKQQMVTRLDNPSRPKDLNSNLSRRVFLAATIDDSHTSFS